MRYFNNPQSIGQLKAEKKEIEAEIWDALYENGDVERYGNEIAALEKEYNALLKKFREEKAIEKHSSTVYFKNPKTLEELDSQYRVFIKKLSGQKGGEKVLEKIEKEYKLLQKEINYNNGKRTLAQQIYRGLSEISEAREYEKQKEREKINSYRSKNYTKADVENLIDSQKKMIYTAIQLYLKKGAVLHANIPEISPSDMLTIVNDTMMGYVRMDKEFSKIVKETAYTLESISIKNNIPLAKLAYQVEQVVGEYAQKTYISLEAQYADPIKIYTRDKDIKQDKKYQRVEHIGSKIMLNLLFWIIPIFLFLVGYVEYSRSKDLEDLFMGIQMGIVYALF